MKLCFATNNKHKIAEIGKILGSEFEIVGLQELGCVEDLPETTGTIEGNSHQKATYVYENFKIPCFADDTGLEVQALGGKPGVDSAYFAGPQRSSADNIALLLDLLSNKIDRTAQFKTVITYIDHNGPMQFTGIVKGKISETQSGVGGFGYDPVFIPEGFTISFAEMTTEEKNKISHRALAVSQLVLFLKKDHS